METTMPESLKQMTKTQRPFSLTIYLLIVAALSWPFQIAYALWGTTPTASYLLSSYRMGKTSEAIRIRVQAARKIQLIRLANIELSTIVANADMRVGRRS